MRCVSTSLPGIPLDSCCEIASGFQSEHHTAQMILLESFWYCCTRKTGRVHSSRCFENDNRSQDALQMCEPPARRFWLKMAGEAGTGVDARLVVVIEEVNVRRVQPASPKTPTVSARAIVPAACHSPQSIWQNLLSAQVIWCCCRNQIP